MDILDLATTGRLFLATDGTAFANWSSKVTGKPGRCAASAFGLGRWSVAAPTRPIAHKEPDDFFSRSICLRFDRSASSALNFSRASCQALTLGAKVRHLASPEQPSAPTGCERNNHNSPIGRCVTEPADDADGADANSRPYQGDPQEDFGSVARGNGCAGRITQTVAVVFVIPAAIPSTFGAPQLPHGSHSGNEADEKAATPAALTDNRAPPMPPIIEAKQVPARVRRGSNKR
jgi:hypothetical protein